MKFTMRNRFLLLACWGICTTCTLAQISPILCGNDLFSDMVRQHYPALQSDFHHTFESALKSRPYRQAEPLTIQVVVNVVWRDAQENLHDSIILDQLRVLNEDFNRLNADTNQLREIFKSEAGSPGIRFELASIQRVQTDRLFQISLLGTNLLSEVKHSDQGGSDAWDPEQYLNLWICKIQPITIFGIELGQVLGFAFPPTNLPHWPADVGAPSPEEDGVVVDFRVVGSNNPNSIQTPGGGGPLQIKGRTPVHEVGHYLGLRHIWGDGGLLGPNDCNQSDGIYDTPYANAQSSFDCNTSRNSCTRVEEHYNEDMPDLVENFMDYSSEDCMNMFTRGQSDLMRNILQGPRSGLLMPFSGMGAGGAVSSFLVWPNPTNGLVVIGFEAEHRVRASVRILSMSGHVVLARPVSIYHPGKHVITLESAFQTPGIYMVEISTETDRVVRRLAVH